MLAASSTSVKDRKKQIERSVPPTTWARKRTPSNRMRETLTAKTQHIETENTGERERERERR